MHARIDLVPIETQEFLSGIQAQIDASRGGGLPGQADAVQFFPPELIPDVVQSIQDGQFASSRDHWQRCGRLEGLSTRKTMPLFLSHLKRLGSEMQVSLAQIGEAPTNPGTFRGAIGRHIILIIRRLLWWHTRSVSAFADAATRGFKQHVGFLEHLAAAQEQNHRTLLSIQQTVSGIGAQLEELMPQQQLAPRICQLESELRFATELNAALESGLRELSIRVNALEERMNGAEAHPSERARPRS